MKLKNYKCKYAEDLGDVFNVEKLCELYNKSDLMSLRYLEPFCVGEQVEVIHRLIALNLKYIEGENIEIDGTEDDYHQGKWKLFEQFGVIKNSEDEMEPMFPSKKLSLVEQITDAKVEMENLSNHQESLLKTVER